MSLSPTRQEIYQQYDKYAAMINLKEGNVLDVGIAGDPKLEGANTPSEKYKWFGEGNYFCTLDNDLKTSPTFVGDIVETNFLTGYWDLVILSQTLEHIWDYKKAIWECFRITKRWFILDTPFMVSWHPTESTPDYWRFTRQAYEKMLTDQGFKIDDLYNSDNLVCALCHVS